MRELFAEAPGPEGWGKSHYMISLIRALEKQGKYDQALSVYHEYQDTEDYKSDAAPHLLSIAELYQKKGEMVAATQKYRQLITMARCSWTVYGFVDLGEIALQGGNLDQALEEFHHGIALGLLSWMPSCKR
jgi:pentatricopeptide repeat protein